MLSHDPHTYSRWVGKPMRKIEQRLNDAERRLQINPTLCQYCGRPPAQRPGVYLPHNHRDAMPESTICSKCNSCPLVVVIDTHVEDFEEGIQRFRSLNDNE
jgi:hypothetical protein